MTTDLNHKEHGRKELGLFLGLQTHKNSTYPKKPFIELFDMAEDFGKLAKIKVAKSIVEDDLFTFKDIKLIDLLLVRIFQCVLHRNWGYYLAGKKPPKVNKNNLRILQNCILYYSKLIKLDFRSKERQRYTRILNISAGHMCLLQDFLESGKNIGLIFEDDAGFETSEKLIAAIFDLVNFTESRNTNACFIDISDSFSFEELGVQHLVTQLNLPEAQKRFFGNEMFQMTRPCTNCRCAVMYNRKMANLFFTGLKRLSIIPGMRIIGADVSLNWILLELARSKDNIDCFHLHPGLFPQLSFLNSNQIFKFFR